MHGVLVDQSIAVVTVSESRRLLAEVAHAARAGDAGLQYPGPDLCGGTPTTGGRALVAYFLECVEVADRLGFDPTVRVRGALAQLLDRPVVAAVSDDGLELPMWSIQFGTPVLGVGLDVLVPLGDRPMVVAHPDGSMSALAPGIPILWSAGIGFTILMPPQACMRIHLAAASRKVVAWA